MLPYPPGRAPSQRFRVEQFFPLLQQHHIPYSVSTFLNDATWRLLYKKGYIFQKAAGIVAGFLRRCKVVLLQSRKYDYIFIHREAAPLGPPVFEWWLAKILKKKIIYDFDDAIWIPNTSEQNGVISKLKFFNKVNSICGWAYIVTAGNPYLCDFANRSGARKTVLLPTVVDTHARYNKQKQHSTSDNLVIGWTGSHSTLKYLDMILPAIRKLQEKYNFTFLVIADKDPRLNVLNYEFIPWKENTEIDDLLKMDIGIMPLVNDAWSEGKCGFKLIQYMALGIPPVASAVGVNKTIINHAENGFLCSTEAEWESYLIKLLEDAPLRKNMGVQAIEKIQHDYSVASQQSKFLQLFNS